MARRGYDGYRGRSTAGDVLSVIACILVVLLVLALAGLVIGQRYIVYTDDGIRLELPFFRREDPDPVPDPGEVNVDIVQLPGSAPETQPEEEYWMRAVWMTPEQLEVEGADGVKAAGANTVVLDMKREDGKLGYVSELELAADAHAREDRITPLLKELHEQKIRAVARVSCFRDNTLGRSSRYAIVTNSGYLWNYDDAGMYWINPTHDAVREYMVGVVKELAALGFDEILLDNCSYPTQGNLGWIRAGQDYDRASLAAYIDQFLSDAQQAVEGTECVLSVLCAEGVFEQTDNLSGQSVQTLAQMDGRVWLSGENRSQLGDYAEKAGVAQERLVWMGAEFEEEPAHLYH